MKKIGLAIILVLTLAAIPLVALRLRGSVNYEGSAAPSDSASLSFSPSNRSLLFNRQSLLNILVDTGGQGIESGGIQLVIDYNPDMVEIIDREPSQNGVQIENNGLYGLAITNQVDPVNGKIFFMAGAFNPGTGQVDPVDSGVVATIHFRTRGSAGPANFDFKFVNMSVTPCDAYRCSGSGCDNCDSDVFLYQSENDDILGQVVNGVINVVDDTPTSTPTSRPTSTATMTPTVVPTQTPTPTPINTLTPTITRYPTLVPTLRPTNTVIPEATQGGQNLCKACPDGSQAPRGSSYDCQMPFTSLANFTLWQEQYQRSVYEGVSIPDNEMYSDYNCNQRIDIGDFSLWLENFLVNY